MNKNIIQKLAKITFACVTCFWVSYGVLAQEGATSRDVNGDATMKSLLNDFYKASRPVGNVTEAAKEWILKLERAVGDNVDSRLAPEAQCRIGDLYRSIGDLEGSILAYQQVFYLPSQDIYARLYAQRKIILGYKALGRWEDALSEYDKLERMIDDIPHKQRNDSRLKEHLAIKPLIRVYKADIYGILGESHKAAEEYEKFVNSLESEAEKLDPWLDANTLGFTPGNILLKAAQEYEKLGSYGKAVSIYEKIMQKYSDTADIGQVAYRYALAKGLEGEQLSAVLEEILRKYPNAPSVIKLYFYLGQNYYFTAHYLKAIDRLQKFQKMSSRCTNISKHQKLYTLHFLAESFYKIGDYSNAIVYSRKLVKELPKENTLIKSANNLIDIAENRLTILDIPIPIDNNLVEQVESERVPTK